MCELSVIIPTYKRSNKLKTLLDGLAQTECDYNAFEIIVVDYGLTDNTFQIAQSLNVRVIRHPHNIGYGRDIKDGIWTA